MFHVFYHIYFWILLLVSATIRTSEGGVGCFGTVYIQAWSRTNETIMICKQFLSNEGSIVNKFGFMLQTHTLIISEHGTSSSLLRNKVAVLSWEDFDIFGTDPKRSWKKTNKKNLIYYKQWKTNLYQSPYFTEGKKMRI